VDALNMVAEAAVAVALTQTPEAVVQSSEAEVAAEVATQGEHQEVTTTVLVGQMELLEPVGNLVVVTAEVGAYLQEA